jgi:hypothetical protein
MFSKEKTEKKKAGIKRASRKRRAISPEGRQRRYAPEGSVHANLAAFLSVSNENCNL